MTTFKITDELIEKIQQLIEQKQNKELTTLLSDLHYADIAEIIHELDTEEGVYIIRLIDAQKTSDVLTELDDDYRENILKNLSAKEIADEIIELDTDDAVDIISELPEDRKTEVISDSSFKMVIPGKTLTEISKIINDSFDMVKIGFSNNQGIFEFENGKLTTKLLEGEFLNYKDIIKTPTETRIKINRNAITESFDRVMLISASSLVKEKKEPVDIQVEIDKLTISCTSSVGMANEEIFTQTEGKEVKLKFNPKFFMDVLKNISNEEIIIDFGTSKSPTMIKPIEDNGEFNYIILPIKSREN